MLASLTPVTSYLANSAAVINLFLRSQRLPRLHRTSLEVVREKAAPVFRAESLKELKVVEHPGVRGG